MLKQFFRISGQEEFFEWDKKNSPNAIAAMHGVQQGIFSGVIYSDILNKRYKKHEIQNITNGNFPGIIPINIDLVVDDEVVHQVKIWLMTKES